MEYRIETNTFWRSITGIYDRGLDWHLADEKIQQITKKKLGLRYIATIYDNEIDKPYDAFFAFEIVDEGKLIWAKLKYGI